MPYERQLAIKGEQVDEALRRIGGLDGFELEPIVAAEQQWRYRNKLEYSFGDDDGEPILGFHAPGRWDLVVDVDDCHLASEAGNAARDAVREMGPAGVDPGLRRRRPRSRGAAQPGRPRGAAHGADPDPPRHRRQRQLPQTPRRPAQIDATGSSEGPTGVLREEYREGGPAG